MTVSPEVVVVGSANVDHRIAVPALPVPGETVLAGAVEALGGGKGANQAVAVARLGRRVGLVAAVGDDAHGSWLRERLLLADVDVSHLTVMPGASGQAFVLVDDAGENSIVVSSGANALLDAGAVAGAAVWLEAAAAVLVQCEIPTAAVAEAARLTRGLLVLNPAPAVRLPDEVWDRVDVVVPNRGELARLHGLDPAAVAVGDLVQLARALPCDRVVVTLGPDGALVVDGDLVETVPAPRVAAVDTTGAGDCFCGALADGLVRGESLTEAARRAAYAGALSVQGAGAQASAPTGAQLEALLGRLGA